MSNKLLLDSQPLVILPELAVAIGLDEAIVLQQIHYWCNFNANAGRNFQDGHYWVYNSMPKWLEQFPWYKKSKLERTFASLKKQDLIITGNYNKLAMDRTNWYRVNYEALQMLIASRSPQNEVMDHFKLTPPLPNIITNNNENGAFTPQAVKSTCSSSMHTENFDVDIPAFIEWYYALYFEIRSVKHPRINKQQEGRVIEELTNFLEDPEFLGVNAEGLQAMARDFFDTVDSNDWRINHFATVGILKNRYYNVYCH